MQIKCILQSMFHCCTSWYTNVCMYMTRFMFPSNFNKQYINVYWMVTRDCSARLSPLKTMVLEFILVLSIIAEMLSNITHNTVYNFMKIIVLLCLFDVLHFQLHMVNVSSIASACLRCVIQCITLSKVLLYFVILP